MKNVSYAYPDTMFYTVHADSHYWMQFSPADGKDPRGPGIGQVTNWVNIQVEGGTHALTSFAKFTRDPEHERDPITVKEVHLKLSEAEAASYSR